MNRFLQFLLPRYKAPTRIWLSSLGTSSVVHLLVGAAIVTWLGTVSTQLFPPRQGSNSIQLTASQLIEVPTTESVEAEEQPITFATSSMQAEFEPKLEPMHRENQVQHIASARTLNRSVNQASIAIGKIEAKRNKEPQRPETATNVTATLPRTDPTKQHSPPSPSAASPAALADAGQLDAIPTKLYSPKPEYPAEALQLGREGRVILRVAIEHDGSVSAASVIRSSGHARLDDAARRAVLRWKFEPPKRLGITVRTEIGVPIHFRIEQPL